jgi:hypothetical protein
MSKSNKKRSVTELENVKTPDAHKRRAQSHVQTQQIQIKKVDILLTLVLEWWRIAR